MEGLKHVVKSDINVEVSFKDTVIVLIIECNVVLTPESVPIVKNWGQKEMEQLADYTAPLIVEMMKKGRKGGK